MSDMQGDPRQLARDILSGKISIADLKREQDRRRMGQTPAGPPPIKPPAPLQPARPMTRPASGSAIPGPPPLRRTGPSPAQRPTPSRYPQPISRPSPPPQRGPQPARAPQQRAPQRPPQAGSRPPQNVPVPQRPVPPPQGVPAPVRPPGGATIRQPQPVRAINPTPIGEIVTLVAPRTTPTFPRGRDSLRQAIISMEILRPPLSLREHDAW